jgi:hypothetical protein
MFQEEAEKHWQYVKSVIEQHNKNLDAETIDIIGFHYVTAMVHGYKHGYNDTMQDNKIDLSTGEINLIPLENLRLKGIEINPINLDCFSQYLRSNESLSVNEAILYCEDDLSSLTKKITLI